MPEKEGKGGHEEVRRDAQSPEVREQAMKRILASLEQGLVFDAFDAGSAVGITREQIKADPECQEAARKYVYAMIARQIGSDSYFDAAVNVIRELGLSMHHARTEAQSAVVVDVLAHRLDPNNAHRFRVAKALFSATPEEERVALKRSFYFYLRGGAIWSCWRIVEDFGLSPEIYGDPKSRNAAEAGIIGALSVGNIRDASAIEEKFRIPDDVVYRLALKCVAGMLKEHGASSTLNVVRTIRHYRIDINDAEYAVDFKNKAQIKFRDELGGGVVEHAKQFAECFALRPEECRMPVTNAFANFLNNGNVKKCVEIVNVFTLPSTLFSEQAMREQAKMGLGIAMSQGRIEDASVIKDLCAMTSIEVKQTARGALQHVLAVGSINNAREIVDVFEPELSHVDPTGMTLNTLIQLRDEPKLQQLYAQDPWHDAAEQLLKLQGRSANAEHDPWQTDMSPLFEHLRLDQFGDRCIDRTKPEDGALLVEYVKTFGMYNLPSMATLFFILKRGATFGALDFDTQRQLRAIIGRRVEKMQGEHIINELRKFRREMLSTLLDDKIPDGIETAVGSEVFSGLKGATQWKGEGTPQEIIALWRKTVNDNPERVKLPEGYRERTIDVPFISRRQPVEHGETKEEQQKKITQLLARTRDGKPTELGTQFALLWRAAEEIRSYEEEEKYNEDWWKDQQQILVKALMFDDSGMEEAVIAREAALREKGTPPEKIAKILEGVRAGYAKKRDEACTAQDAVRRLQYPKFSGETFEEYDEDMVPFMHRVAMLPRKDAVRSALLVLSMQHMKNVARDWEERLRNMLPNLDAPILREHLFGVHDVYTQYINEHYLHQGQDQNHTRHTPFSPELRDALLWAYGIPKDMDTHVFSRVRKQIDVMENGELVASNEKMTIALVPSQGLLRIYSGDIGDACYTSRHRNLAAGEYPDLHAMTFVTNRGIPQERLNGSVLFIETRTPKGENVLLVRANNPRENLIQQVDADALVEQIIVQAIATAKELGMDVVAVPLDKATASSSNRSAVSAYYKKHFSSAQKIELVQEPETTFNGYDVWNSAGAHPSVVVWRRGMTS